MTSKERDKLIHVRRTILAQVPFPVELRKLDAKCVLNGVRAMGLQAVVETLDGLIGDQGGQFD